MAEAAVLIGQDREKDLGAVEGRQRYEIEDGEDNVDDHYSRNDFKERHP